MDWLDDLVSASTTPKSKAKKRDWLDDLVDSEPEPRAPEVEATKTKAEIVDAETSYAEKKIAMGKKLGKHPDSPEVSEALNGPQPNYAARGYVPEERENSQYTGPYSVGEMSTAIQDVAGFASQGSLDLMEHQLQPGVETATEKIKKSTGIKAVEDLVGRGVSSIRRSALGIPDDDPAAGALDVAIGLAVSTVGAEVTGKILTKLGPAATPEAIKLESEAAMARRLTTNDPLAKATLFGQRLPEGPSPSVVAPEALSGKLSSGLTEKPASYSQPVVDDVGLVRQQELIKQHLKVDVTNEVPTERTGEPARVEKQTLFKSSEPAASIAERTPEEMAKRPLFEVKGKEGTYRYPVPYTSEEVKSAARQQAERGDENRTDTVIMPAPKIRPAEMVREQDKGTPAHIEDVTRVYLELRKKFDTTVDDMTFRREQQEAATNKIKNEIFAIPYNQTVPSELMNKLQQSQTEELAYDLHSDEILSKIFNPIELAFFKQARGVRYSAEYIRTHYHDNAEADSMYKNITIDPYDVLRSQNTPAQSRQMSLEDQAVSQSNRVQRAREKSSIDDIARQYSQNTGIAFRFLQSGTTQQGQMSVTAAEIDPDLSPRDYAHTLNHEAIHGITGIRGQTPLPQFLFAQEVGLAAVRSLVSSIPQHLSQHAEDVLADHAMNRYLSQIGSHIEATQYQKRRLEDVLIPIAEKKYHNRYSQLHLVDSAGHIYALPQAQANAPYDELLNWAVDHTAANDDPSLIAKFKKHPELWQQLQASAAYHLASGGLALYKKFLTPAQYVSAVKAQEQRMQDINAGKLTQPNMPWDEEEIRKEEDTVMRELARRAFPAEFAAPVPSQIVTAANPPMVRPTRVEEGKEPSFILEFNKQVSKLNIALHDVITQDPTHFASTPSIQGGWASIMPRALPVTPEGSAALMAKLADWKLSLQKFPQSLALIQKIVQDKTKGPFQKFREIMPTILDPIYETAIRDPITIIFDMSVPYFAKNLLTQRQKETQRLEALRLHVETAHILGFQLRREMNAGFQAAIPEEWHKAMRAALRSPELYNRFIQQGKFPLSRITDKDTVGKWTKHVWYAIKNSAPQFLGEGYNERETQDIIGWIDQHGFEDINPVPDTKIGRGIDYLRKDAVGLWNQAYDQFSLVRDWIEWFFKTYGLGEKVTKNLYMPQINDLHEMEKLVQHRGLIDQAMDAVSLGGQQRLFTPKMATGHAEHQVKKSGFNPDPGGSLSRVTEDLVTEALKKIGAEWVKADPRLSVPAKGKNIPTGFKHINEPRSPLFDQAVHPDVLRALGIEASTTNNFPAMYKPVFALFKILTALPRKLMTTLSFWGGPMNWQWGRMMWEAATSRVIPGKSTYDEMILTHKYHMQMGELAKKSLSQIPDEDGSVKDAEMMGVLNLNYRFDPIFSEQKDYFIRYYEKASGMKAPLGAFASLGKVALAMSKVDEVMSHIYVSPDRMFGWMIYHDLVKRGVPKIKAAAMAKDAIVDPSKAGSVWQATNAVGFGPMFMGWRQLALGALARVGLRNPLAIWKAKFNVLLVSTVVSTILGYHPAKHLTARDFIPTNMKTWGYSETGEKTGHIRVDNYDTILNQFGMVDSVYRGGIKGFVNSLKNNPIMGMFEVADNKDKDGRPISDLRMLRFDVGKSVVTGETREYLIHRWLAAGSMSKVIKYTKIFKTGKTAYGDPMGTSDVINAFTDTVMGLRGYDIEVDKQYRAGIKDYQDAISDIRGVYKAIDDPRYVEMHKLTPEQVAQFKKEAGPRIDELMKQADELEKSYREQSK